MHELSIALSILDCAAEESRRRGNARITAVHLKLGPLAGVMKGALESAFALAREDADGLTECELKIEDLPIVVYCPACGVAGAVKPGGEMRCGICGTLTADLRQGREMEICAMEICS